MNLENIMPINRVFIEIVPEVSEYRGVLELAPTSQEKSNIGIVRALPEADSNPSRFSVGDKVLFNRHSGTTLKFDKFNKDAPEFRLIDEKDIFAKILD